MKIIAFFDDIERQFHELKIPKELHALLMKPYLNDRARVLINRVDASHSADYNYVKDFLLQEFRLVPQQARRGGRVVSASASESVVHRFEYRRRHLVDA